MWSAWVQQLDMHVLICVEYNIEFKKVGSQKGWFVVFLSLN